MTYRLLAAMTTSLLFAGCAQIADVEPTEVPSVETPAAHSAEAPVPPIASGEMVIKFQIGDQDPRDWTITPELSPDTLVFECPQGETIPVRFETDLETRTIPMTIEQDSLQFDIIVNQDVVALTELKCIEEIVRYEGDFSADRADAGNYASDIGPVLDTYFSAEGPGAILGIVEGDTVLFETAIGRDSIEDQTDRQVTEAFDIASVSKEFTAIAIMQLQERGLLSFEDKLSQYFDDLPNGDQITLHHMLTHTHGLSQIRTGEGYDDTIPREIDVALDHIRAQGAKFEPGDRYDYGNTSYYLLAMIAEQVSGLDREAYVRKHMFEPAGMMQSSFIWDDPASLRRVGAYNEVDGEQTPRTFENHLPNAVGAGGIVSTLEDMHRWQRAVSNGTLISPDMFALAVAPKTLNDGSQIERGYGFFYGELDGELIIYNTGDFFTHTRHFYMPARDLSIILNTNGTPEYDGGQSSIVWLQIVGKVLNLQTVEIFGDEIDLNDL